MIYPSGFPEEIHDMIPNDQHFAQLARQINEMNQSSIYTFFIKLGLPISDYEKLSQRFSSNQMNFVLMGLIEWRRKKEIRKEKAKFSALLNALKTVEHVEVEHILCQVRFMIYYIFF